MAFLTKLNKYVFKSIFYGIRQIIKKQKKKNSTYFLVIKVGRIQRKYTQKVTICRYISFLKLVARFFSR